MNQKFSKIIRFFSNLLNDVAETIDPDDKENPKAAPKTKVPAGRKPNLDNFDEAATDIFNLRDIEEDLSDFWWYKEEDEKKDTPKFEAINDEEVCEDLHKRIENNEFPVIEIPDTVMRTMQILNNPEFDYLEVANLINHSPAMAGEFIKVTNSSVYSRGVDISDLKLALPRLGRENIKAMLFMYSSKLSLAENPLFNDLAVSIVDHSYATGLIATYLSHRYFPDPDSAFLAGLLHDIGKLGILKAISQMYDLPSSVDFDMNEHVFDNIFPTLHERAGCFLGKNWKLHKTVLAAIEHHHDFWDTPFGEETQLELHLSALISLSDTMARLLGYGRPLTEAVNIFEHPACIHLNIERNHDTIKFIGDIPEIITFKTTQRD